MKKITITLLFLIVVLLGMLGLKNLLLPDTTEGNKDIIVCVTAKNRTCYEHSTELKLLGETLDEMELIETSDSTFGRFVTGVDGYTANPSKEEWWLISINELGIQLSIDDTAINNGDIIDLILKTGY